MSASSARSEKVVRDELERQYHQRFTEQELSVGSRLDGSEGQKNFDAVSDDRNIVAMVKDLTADNEKHNRVTRLPRVMQDLLLLHLVDAEFKYMYLSEAFRSWMESYRDAVIPDDVVVRLIPSAD